MKNVLITGGNGALGKAVIMKMTQLNEFHIFVASRKSPNTKTSITCDVREESQIIAAIKYSNPDIIIHLASTLSSDLTEACSVNVNAAMHILNFIKSKALKTRVILIGSAAEYGIVLPHESPIKEDHVLAPVSAYGVSKAWQTQLMGIYVSQGVDVLCARIFNLYGSGISEQLFSGRLAMQITDVLEKRKEKIEVGDLSAVRDYISITDAAEQLLAIMSRGESGKIYHVASGVPCLMRDFAHALLRNNDLDTAILKESPVFSNHRGYDVPVIFADIASTIGL